MSDNKNVLIEVRDLCKSFDHVNVLNGISTTISQGEVVAIIGPSGCGKSTFLRSMNLLEKPTSGSILFEGTDITDSSVDINKMRQKIGMVFQQFNLFPHMTVLENLIEAPVQVQKRNRDEVIEEAKVLLSKVGLLEKAHEYPRRLSGGQQQRVGIARALANDPRVLLSDEATSALDPETTIATLELLKRINKELGLTIVMITHQMDVVKQICDRVAVMNKGIVVEEGSVIDVFRRPQTETTKALIGNIMAQELPGSMLERVREQVADLDKGSVHILRLSFVGSEVTRPGISEASRMFNIDVNILLGQVDEVQGKGFGTLTILTSCNTDTFSQLLEYLRKHNVTVEEVTSHVL